jgi:hypothetical protein
VTARSLTNLSAAILIGMGTACSASVQYASDYDPTANFSNITTYQWASRTPSGDDDPRVYNTITMRKVRHATDLALQARGMSEVGQNPDVYIAWHGAINGKMNVQTVSSNYGYGYGWYGPGYGGMGMGSSTTYVNEWDEGTLIIDIIDAKRNELMWRGSAEAELKKNQDATEGQQALNDILVRLLAPFPPAPAGS